MFHLLRRHVKRNFRKPLIVMTPKKFLRVETATTDELVKGRFEHAIDDAGVKDASKVRRVIYCTGKVFHELAERRAAIGKQETAIVRIEQLYPFHAEQVRGIDSRYPKAAERVWVQEEPRNAGAYLYIADVFRENLGVSLGYCGRPASASPATGSEYAHKRQQEAILSSAIGPLGPSPEGAKPRQPEAPSGGVNGAPREVVTSKKAASKAGR
jgi:2-oxoglutarate dehydrogenase E1 component